MRLRDYASSVAFAQVRRIVVDRVGAGIPKHVTRIIHNSRCHVSKIRLHVAGTPCISWSPWGFHLGASGPILLIFMTWVAQRLVFRESHILHDNVPGCGMGMLVGLFGSIYARHSLIANHVVWCPIIPTASTDMDDAERCFDWAHADPQIHAMVNST